MNLAAVMQCCVMLVYKSVAASSQLQQCFVTQSGNDQRIAQLWSTHTGTTHGLSINCCCLPQVVRQHESGAALDEVRVANMRAAIRIAHQVGGTEQQALQPLHPVCIAASLHICSSYGAAFACKAPAWACMQ
jgi:hypothetical protein